MKFEDNAQADGWYPWSRPRLVGIPDRPSFDSHSMHAVFRMPDEPLRSFRIVVDARLLTQAPTNPVVKYLLELVATSPIEAHLYESGQSSPHTAPIISTETGTFAYRDWITIESGSAKNRYVHFIQDRQPKKRPITSTSAQYFHGLADNVDEQTRELLLAAHYSQADLVITTGVNAEQLPPNLVNHLDVLAPDIALPVVGLYLRTQGKFVLGNRRLLGGQTPQPPISKQSRSIFYWGLAKCLLPQLPAIETLVTSELVRSRSSRWDGPALCRSLGWRVDQILRSRDRLLSNAFAVPLDHGPTDEIASEVDTIVLYSMSVLDITARLAEMLFLSEQPENRPGWQKVDWIKKLKQREFKTATLFDESSAGTLFMKVLPLIRNTIHAEAFSSTGVTYIVGPNRFQPLVRLRPEIAEKLHSWFNQFGSPKEWGFVEAVGEEGSFIHLGVLAERLCLETLRLSNDILKLLVEDASSIHDLTHHMPHEIPLTVPDMRALLQTGLVEFAGSPFRDEPVALDERGGTMIRTKRPGARQ